MPVNARLRTLGLAAAASVFATAAPAAPISLLSQTFTADAGAPAPSGITLSLAGSANLGGDLIYPPNLIDVPFDGALSITVTDLGLVGDVYEVLLDGASLGTTSAVPIGGPTPSSGVFTAPVLAGYHQLDLWDFVQTYINTGTSPYGGGAVTDAYDDSDVSVDVSLVPTSTAVPEPAALAVLLPAGLAAFRRRPAS